MTSFILGNHNYERDESLDYMKGVLIFFVVYGHCLYWMGTTIQKPYSFIAEFIYSFHMPLFIFLSGYFFSPSKRNNIIDTICTKFSRLIIPHFFFNIIMIIPVICFWQQFGHFITRESEGIITMKSIYLYFTMFWFLWCVFFSSILCNIIYIKISSFSEPTCLLVSILLFTTSDILSINVFFVHQRMSDMFFYFVLGVIAYDHKKTLNSRVITAGSIGAFIIYIAYLYSLYHSNDEMPSLVVEIGQLSGLVIMFCIIKLLYKIHFAKSYFLFISKWTLGIYIYHFVLLYGIMEWYNKNWGGLGNHLVYINSAITFISTLIVSFFTSLMNRNSFLGRYALGNKKNIYMITKNAHNNHNTFC